MIKLQVVRKSKSEYFLIDKDNNNYKLNLYFYDTDIDFKYIYMSYELLNPNYFEYSNRYNFGPLGTVYGRKLSTSTIQDLVILENDTDRIFLQRYYG